MNRPLSTIALLQQAGVAPKSRSWETVGMSKHGRALQFFEKIEHGKPIRGRCSLCKRQFIGESKPGEGTDDVLQRMRAEFDAHNCNEETREIVARIVRKVTGKM